ncbi:MAG: pyridoxamine 5'-phosphate oxidase family protein [Ruminiclostridium sp.]|nr:pyridoxamine 5'-phosphate oxidase family protein [Ruminiclostridium sp.]
MTKDEIMNLIDRSLFAEIGYRGESGYPEIRRVFCVWHKGLGRHLISTNTGSSHVQSIMNDPVGCLYFADSESFEGVCLYGRFKPRFDSEYRQLLWHDGDEKYYPKGVEDEDYCVLEFTAEKARYYRFDGKGELTRGELEEYDKDKKYADGYAKTAGNNK